jgi:hypothetical protein
MRVEKGVVMAELRGYALMAVMIRLLFSFFMLALMGCAVREAPPSPSPIPPSPIRGYGGSSPLSSPSSPVIPRSSSPPPETQKFSSITEDINTSTEVLPSGFVGADPQSTVEWFKKALSQIPIKIDQYSTATERAQFDQLRDQQFNSLGLLPFTLPESSYHCQKKYNPDTQRFSFGLSTSSYVSSSELYKRYGSNMSKVSIYTERNSLGSHEASNAFGAKVTVNQVSIKEITVSFR